MSRTAAIRAGRAQVELSVDRSALVAGLRRAQASIQRFGANVASVARGFAVASGAIAGPLAGAVAMAGSAGDQLDKMARRTGLSVEALSELSFAAGRSGTDLAAIEKSARQMTRQLRLAQQGSKQASLAFADLGLNVDEISAMHPDQAFRAISAALAGVEDPMKRAAIATELFGRSGTALLPMIADLDALTAEAQRLGLTMSTEDAQAAADYTDAMGDLQSVLKRVAIEIGNALLPVVTDAAKAIAAAVVPIIAWVRENRYIVAIAAAVAAALLLIAGALAAVATVASIVSFIIGGLISAMTALAAVFAAITSPIGLAIIAAVALYGTLGYLLSRTQVGQRVLGALGETFRRVAGYIAEFGRAMWAAISAGNWQAALELAQSALLVVWTTTKNKMLDIWAQFTAMLQDGFFLALYTIREAWDMFADAFEGRLLRIAKMITGLGGSFLLGQLEGVREDLEALEGLQGEANDARRRDEAERRRAARRAEQDAMDRYRAALAAANAAGEVSKAESKAKEATVAGAAVAEETSSRILSLGTFSGSLAKQLGRGQAFDQVVKETRRAADAAEGIEDRLDNINELAFA